MPIASIVTREYQESLSPSQVLEFLKEGNQRFLNNEKIERDFDQQRKNLKSAQHPIAIILGCIDSRVPSELIFDLGLGDVFNVRIAGNILNDDVLGSLEFACKVVGAKLIVVMGHTDCGAIKAACNGVRLAHISSIMEKIDPVIHSIKNRATQTEEDFVINVTHANTVRVKGEIMEKSEILRDMKKQGEIEIVNAVYCVESGIVSFGE
jgi:carbonic anhydrase